MQHLASLETTRQLPNSIPSRTLRKLRVWHDTALLFNLIPLRQGRPFGFPSLTHTSESNRPGVAAADHAGDSYLAEPRMHRWIVLRFSLPTLHIRQLAL